MLTIKDLKVSISDKQILKGIDLEVNPGEVHAIMGPNGSGKSTLAAVLAGREIAEVNNGSIIYKGEEYANKEIIFTLIHCFGFYYNGIFIHE